MGIVLRLTGLVMVSVIKVLIVIWVILSTLTVPASVSTLWGLYLRVQTMMGMVLIPPSTVMIMTHRFIRGHLIYPTTVSIKIVMGSILPVRVPQPLTKATRLMSLPLPSLSGDGICNMQFTVTGAPSSVSCPTCTYVFDMTISMDATSIYNSTFAHCTALSNSMVVPYGFVNNYNGTGEQALLLYENGAWVPFAINNTVNYGMVDMVNFTSTTFNYSVGYMDYYASSSYGTGYHTNYWTGSGIAN